jgi:hypothetical protein
MVGGLGVRGSGLVLVLGLAAIRCGPAGAGTSTDLGMRAEAGTTNGGADASDGALSGDAADTGLAADAADAAPIADASDGGPPPDAGPSADAAPSDGGEPPDAGPAADAAPGDGGGITIAIMPTSTSVPSNGTIQFTAQVMGTANTAVVFSLPDGAGSGGIDPSTGLYTAPNATVTAIYHVEATSVADPRISAIAQVIVTPVITVQVAPPTATLSPGEQQRFSATVSGASNTAVIWSATGGSIDQTGLYTAGTTVNASFHVVATSIEDPTQSATATVTVLPDITVSFCLTTAIAPTGTSLPFPATVTGTPNTTVVYSMAFSSLGPDGGAIDAGTFDAAADGGPIDCGSINAQGLFTAPTDLSACPNPLLTITAVSVADPRRSASANVLISPSRSGLSGTVVYGGPRSGRVFVNLASTSMQGSATFATSIAGPGPFTFVGGPLPNDTYIAHAWMDVLGVGVFNPAIDPYSVFEFEVGARAGDGGILDSSSDAGALSAWPQTITLVDPAPATPVSPSVRMAIPYEGGAIVGFGPSRDSSSNESADHYRVYASTTPNPGPANTTFSNTVRAGDEQIAAVSPLTNGVGYYFAVAAINNGVESVPGPAYGPVRAGPVAGGFTASGTVDVSALSNPGTLYVVLSGSDTAYVTRIATPSATSAFTISGILNGSYTLGAFLDMDSDGEIDPTDPLTFRHVAPQTYVTVNGSDPTGLHLSLPAGDGLARAESSHFFQSPNGSDSYEIALRVGPNLKMPVHAIGFGPNAPPRDLGFRDIGPGGELQLSEFISERTSPAIGDGYAFQVTYADGTTCNLSASVSAVLSLPTALAPSGTGPPTPLFSWTPPSPPPSGPYVYALYLQQVGTNNRVWSYEQIPSTQTSVAYNSDPGHTASQAALTPGVEYSWTLSVQDEDGNSSRAAVTFTAQ